MPPRAMSAATMRAAAKVLAKDHEPETLAEAIRKISAAVRDLERSGVNKKGVLVLLAHASGLSMGTCRLVVDSLDQLAAQYCSR